MSDDLTPPGPQDPPGDDEQARGGMSVDDWIAARPAVAPSPYTPLPAPGTPPPWREFDRTSLLGLALALTAVAAPIGVVLGIRGIRRTADGTRGGRWAAILAIVVGILATLGLVAGAFGVVWFRDHVRNLDRVDAGMCVDVDDSDGVAFDVRSCSDPHQAEIVAAGDYGGKEEALHLNASASEFCFGLADERYRRAARSGEYDVTLVVGAPDPAYPRVGDAYACYYTRADGRLLSDPIRSGEAES